MGSYRVQIHRGITLTYEIDAESQEEAEEQALGRSESEDWHRLVDDADSEVWKSEDLDERWFAVDADDGYWGVDDEYGESLYKTGLTEQAAHDLAWAHNHGAKDHEDALRMIAERNAETSATVEG